MSELFLGLDPWVLLLLLLSACFAGWIDAVVGGGGLVQLPAVLLLTNLSPLQALATNKLGSIFGSATSSITYYLKVRPDPKIFLPMAIVAGIGSYLGAVFASRIPKQALLPIILVALIVVLFITIFRNRKKKQPQRQFSAKQTVGYAVAFGLVIGAYDGLLGPGTGTFLIIALVSIIGYEFLAASATAKIVNFATNLGALIYFSLIAAVQIELGILLGLANSLGGFIGARTAIKRGNGFVRMALIVVVSVLILKLAWDIFLQA